MRALIILFALALVCCTPNEEPSSHGNDRVTKLPEPDPAEEIDERLLVCLSQAKNFHHIARVYMSDGNLDEAIATVRKIFAIRCPDGAPEAEDIRLDAFAMLGKLLLAQGKLEDAMKSVDEGIASKTRDSFFLANLYTVKGECYEAIAADLTPGSEQAKAVKHSAIDSYTRSNQINEELQKKLYQDVTGETP